VRPRGVQSQRLIWICVAIEHAVLVLRGLVGVVFPTTPGWLIDAKDVRRPGASPDPASPSRAWKSLFTQHAYKIYRRFV
jgi:hypothetical protein